MDHHHAKRCSSAASNLTLFYWMDASMGPHYANGAARLLPLFGRMPRWTPPHKTEKLGCSQVAAPLLDGCSDGPPPHMCNAVPFNLRSFWSMDASTDIHYTKWCCSVASNLHFPGWIDASIDTHHTNAFRLSPFCNSFLGWMPRWTSFASNLFFLAG